MYISRVQIRNFRNFANLDIPLAPNAVIVGENRCGKSNFIHALRLVLDISLPDSARNLKLTDIWDGHDSTVEPRVEVLVDFSDFDGDEEHLALLGDYRLAADHTTARLSYVFRKKEDVTGMPRTETDFEFRVYGGETETTSVKGSTRQRICFALLQALRDAETELGIWKMSPLRGLLDDAVSKIPADELERVATEVKEANTEVTALEPIQELETKLKTKISDLSGVAQDIQARLGVAPTDPHLLFRSIRLLIDDGKRGISDASLGSANLALLTLRLSELEWIREQRKSNFTLVCIEEPEAHLHPHLQRSVFRKLLAETEQQPLSLLLTTHSPQVASVAPLSSLVVLKQESEIGTKGYSLAKLPFADDEKEDVQRYLDVSRAEILFSKGVIFVEGDSEETLVPVFARALDLDLDELGIAVCNVGGTNFSPYVRLAAALNLPFCVLTDWDPGETDAVPLGFGRVTGLVDGVRALKGEPALTDEEKAVFQADYPAFQRLAKTLGFFTNETTLELEISGTPALRNALLDALNPAQFGKRRQTRITAWKEGTEVVDPEQLLCIIGDLGKGRVAARLAPMVEELTPPTYIREAIEYITAHG